MLAAADHLFAVVVDAQVHQVELVAEHLLLLQKGPELIPSHQQGALGRTRQHKAQDARTQNHHKAR